MSLRPSSCRRFLGRLPYGTLLNFMRADLLRPAHSGSCICCLTSSADESHCINKDLSSGTKETRAEANQDDKDENEGVADEDYMRPQPRKERIRKCLAKLKKGPDGRFVNVLEVASDINMLIAAYQNLKAQERPTYLIEDSDEDDSMEGINIERFKKLQKRLRTGTYKFGSVKKPDESESCDELE